MIPIHHKETSKARHLSSGCDVIQTVFFTSMSALERNALEDQESQVSPVLPYWYWARLHLLAHMSAYVLKTLRKWHNHHPTFIL